LLPMIEIGLTDLPKPGWAIAHPAHPSPTSLDVVGFTYEAVNERMLVNILRATQHMTVGQYSKLCSTLCLNNLYPISTHIVRN
jgi:hypothetical protein